MIKKKTTLKLDYLVHGRHTGPYFTIGVHLLLTVLRLADGHGRQVTLSPSSIRYSNFHRTYLDWP